LAQIRALLEASQKVRFAGHGSAAVDEVGGGALFGVFAEADVPESDGVHPNTAFGSVFALDWVRPVNDAEFEAEIVKSVESPQASITSEVCLVSSTTIYEGVDVRFQTTVMSSFWPKAFAASAIYWGPA